MVFRPLRRLSVLVAAFVFQALAIGQSAPIQATPAAAQPQRDAQQASQTSGSAADEEKALRRYLTRTRYLYFVEFVDRENFLNQSVERTDYKSAIGISDIEERVMSSIVLDASSKVIDDWDQNDAATKRFLQAHGRGEKLSDNTEFKALGENLQTLVDEMRANLKNELGEEFIKKLDAYVNREFINRIGPVSLRLNKSKLTENASASRHAQPEAPALADRRAFELFFELAGAAVERKQEAVAEGKATQANILPRSTPEDKKQEIFAIVLEAHRQLYENSLQEHAAIGDYHLEHGPQPIPNPLPNEFVVLGRKHWAIVDEHIAKLKHLLGEEEFRKLDEYVNRVFGKELASAATDPANPPEPR
jgi:hypothetical protein